MIKSRFADTVGDGSGSINAAVDGSSTPVIFRIKPGPSETFYIQRVIISIIDNGSLDSGGYGNGVELTNGVQILYKRFVGEAGETTLIDLTGGLPITQNMQWHALCHDETLSTYGSGDQGASWRYTFSKDTGGDPIILNGANKEELQFVIRDNISTLAEQHYFRIGMS